MTDDRQERPIASQQFGNTVVDNGSSLFQGIVNGDVHLGPRESRLHSLDIASGATFNAANKQNSPSCLENTRVDLLQQIESWAESRDEKRIYWLRGMAGTGKSTIALTIASRYAEKGRLGASFFFSRGGGDLASAKKFVPTIAAQLAEAVPGLHECIDRALDSNRHILDLGVYSQWQKLVLEPLAQLGKDTITHPVVVVIDALDECDDDNDISLLVKCFEVATTTSNGSLRVFITSRPESLINYAFDGIPRHARTDFVLHNIEDYIVDQDLALLYQDRLSKIARRFHLDATLYSEHTIQILVRKSHRLFIHAATVCRFIQEGKGLAGQRLALLVDKGDASLRPERELDQMYNTVLTHSWSTSAHLEPQESADMKTLFSDIVGSIVVLFDVVNMLELATILDRSEDEVGRILRSFHSVLDVPEEPTKPIRLLHPSFRDFLLDRSRYKAEPFSIDSEEIHRLLFGNCLRLLKFHLKRNVCNLNHPGVRVRDVAKATVNDCIPYEIQYACRYWFHHLQRIDLDANVKKQLEGFFTTGFLYWLECLSLLHRVPDGVTMIRLLDTMFLPSTSTAPATILMSKMKSMWQKEKGKVNWPPSLSDIVHDAMRFLLYHGSIIDEAPLQIYCSALVFSPHASIIRKLYSHLIPTWLTRQNIGLADWGTHVQAINLPEVSEQIVYSLDGQLVASASFTSRFPKADTGAKQTTIIRVFVAATGTEQAIIHVHCEANDYLLCVAFSPNNHFLVSGTHRGSIRVWDVYTGEEHLAVNWPDLNRADDLTAVTFSPDGRFIAAAKERKEVRLWDVSTGREHCFVEGDLNWMRRIVFCQDSFLTMPGSNEQSRPIQLWHKAPFLEYFDWNRSHQGRRNTTFSPDLRLAAVHRYNSSRIQLWDISKSERIHTLYQQNGLMAFSPNSRMLAVAFQRTITLWDTSTGTRQRIIEEDSVIHALAVSPNGQLASATWTAIIHLWSAQERKQLTIKYETVQADREPRRTLAISRDGRKVASILKTSNNAVIQVCGDMADPAPHEFKRSWADSSYSVLKFSEDNRYLAIVLPGREALVLDAATGHIQWSSTRKNLSSSILQVSPDSRLVSLQTNDILEVFDVVTGKLKYNFKQQRHLRIYTSAFSPDSCLLALLVENEIRILDASTGQLRQRIALGDWKGLRVKRSIIQFSPNGQLLAVGRPFQGVYITLFDAATGRSISTIQKSTVELSPPCDIGHVTFSPDSRLLLSFSTSDKDGDLWEVATGKCLHKIGHSGRRDAMAFSPDSQRLFWQDDDRNICLLDIAGSETLRLYSGLPFLQVISVSSCGAYLITERGTLGLPWLRPHPLSHFFAFLDWITNDGEDLINIHHDYRKHVHFSHGDDVYFDYQPDSFLRINTSSHFAVSQDIPRGRDNREDSTYGDR